MTDENADRVRANTSDEVNAEIDREMETRVQSYADANHEEITQRIEELEREWDMERVLETNASAIALAGVGLSAATNNKKWLFVPGVVLSFLFQHAVQGWCPPVPIFRRLGVRTRQEIDSEKYALKVLRGDFNQTSSNTGADDFEQAWEALETVKK
ncbi:MAG TPA: hypothetical protein VK892_05120 [Pyrinomonadaceae bacterium]|nr:hypothetical protein [Pyrinomonadaceae bacterium]